MIDRGTAAVLPDVTLFLGFNRSCWADAFGWSTLNLPFDSHLVYTAAKKISIFTDKLRIDLDPSAPVLLHPKIRKLLETLEKNPSKNSTPPCACPTVGANYRGIVTADVLSVRT